MSDRQEETLNPKQGWEGYGQEAQEWFACSVGIMETVMRICVGEGGGFDHGLFLGPSSFTASS